MGGGCVVWGRNAGGREKRGSVGEGVAEPANVRNPSGEIVRGSVSFLPEARGEQPREICLGVLRLAGEEALEGGLVGIDPVGEGCSRGRCCGGHCVWASRGGWILVRIREFC